MSSSVTAQPTSFGDLQRLGDTNNSPKPVSNYMPTTPAGASLLSPFQTYLVYSNSASPSNLSTPGELNSSENGVFSEYSDCHGDDEFFGVDFDAGEQDIDGDPALVDIPLPTTELPVVEAYLPRPHIDITQPPANRTNPTYPLSPKHSSPPNSQSPKSETQETRAGMTASGYGYQMNINASQPALPGANLVSTANLQPTPERSGSSHTSAEGILPSMPAHLGHSPRVTLTAWGSKEEQEIPTEPDNEDLQYNVGSSQLYYGLGVGLTSNQQFLDHGLAQSLAVHHLKAEQDQFQVWVISEGTGRTGLDPDERKSLAEVEVPNFKDQEEQERLKMRNQEVEQWRSQAGKGTDSDNETSEGSNFALGVSITNPEFDPASSALKGPDEGSDIDPVSETQSVRENQLEEGQIYFNQEATQIKDADRELMQQPRHWSDAPRFPGITTTTFQPQTSSDAVQRFNELADNNSVFSRSATWGTRRRSEPSLSDIESIQDGSFLKRLSIGKCKERRPRPAGLFDQLTNIMKRSNSNKLKRSGSDRDGRAHHDFDSHSRKDNQSTLAPPSRSPSSSRRRPTSPRLNTRLAASPIIGLAHDRHHSLSATSPKHTLSDFLGSVRRRSRSKSELQSGSGLVGLWRESGGPPVPTLASQPLDSEGIKQPDHSDVEGEDDEDDDVVDDGEKMDFDEETPIIPNFAGFQEHVLRLNATMETNYLVDRIAHQQVVRYKTLLGWRVKHASAIVNKSCTAGPHCMAQDGSVTLYDAKGAPREKMLSNSGLQVTSDMSDGDSNPEGALSAESFPKGVPMPPTQTLPAEFECQLCFRVKKFMKPSDWTKHVHEDVQPFTCTYQNCREPKSFKRKADWVRHENERHRHLEWWTCQVEDCTHKCYRKDNFLQHLVREHKLPEPKQKTKAAVKKARGNDEVVWAMVRSCHHETTTKPQEEPCKFCGRILTSWKKLTVHLAKHMEHISLPVLRLVEQQQVDANTIISPVEALPIRPTPLTPIGGDKRLSNSPHQFGNMNASISPNVQPMPQFQNPVYPVHTSPNAHAIPQFSGNPFGQSMIYNPNSSVPDMSFNIQAPISQHPHRIMFDNNAVSYNTYNQIGSQMSTAQPQGYAPIDQSPNIDHSRVFTTVNQNYNNPMVQSGYQSYSNSNHSAHTLSPDPSPFVSAAQQIPGFQPHTLSPDHGKFVSGAHQVTSFGSRDVLGISDDNSYNFPNNDGTDGAAGLGYGSISIPRNQSSPASFHSAQSNPSAGGDYAQMRMSRGQGGSTYPPSSSASYGYHS